MLSFRKQDPPTTNQQTTRQFIDDLYPLVQTLRDNTTEWYTLSKYHDEKPEAHLFAGRLRRIMYTHYKLRITCRIWKTDTGMWVVSVRYNNDAPVRKHRNRRRETQNA